MSSPLRRPRQTDDENANDNNNLPAPVSPPNTAASSTTSLHDRLLSLLNEVFTADSHKKMFHFPVSSQDLPEYKNIIKNPMDLTTIKNKIIEDKKNSNGAVAPPPSSGTFASPLITEVYNNLNLMISNALVFNKGRKNPYRRHAKKIQKVIDAAWEKRPELEVAEDDIDFVPDEDAEDEEDFDDDENENNNSDNDMMIVDEDDGGDENGAGGSSSAMKNSKKDGNEDIAATVKALEEEAAEPIDVLKAKYAKLMMEQQQDDDSDDDDEEDDEEEESDDDFDDEEEEEEESDDDDDE